MRGRTLQGALIALAALALFFCGAPAVDAGGAPQRIISLAPNLTEILFALGLEDRIVGVTTFCDAPEEAKRKPKIGGMSTPSLEAILAAKPDLVVVNTDGNQREFEKRLRAFRIKTYVFTARRIHDLPAAIREMGAVLEVRENADRLAREIETALATMTEKRRLSSRRILYIVWPEPLIVAGPGTAVHDAISLIGQKNIAAQAPMAYPKYSLEEVLRRSPDIIIIGKGHGIGEVSEKLLKRLRSVPAVQGGHVYYMSDNLYRLGPRLVKGLEELSGIVDRDAAKR
ncbi:MAG: helical backbone metal receptor [Alphaproteobacteria bacterium]|uniref:Helical backbone metal receptor n=1 Tax=Candidatus Nitrobium versatile TaxID=2884831 RepID=A0A953J4P1_9BACT|nr:helical backbone metal receptor [Candidatus Nitrobium versatile]